MKKGLGRCHGVCSAIDGEFIQGEVVTSPNNPDNSLFQQKGDMHPQSEAACGLYKSVFAAQNKSE